MGDKQSTRDKAERNERQSDAQQSSNQIQKKIKKEKKDMYGGFASKEANKFIKNQPASKGYYMTTKAGKMILDSNKMPILTSRGYKLKYGNSGAMGIGEKSIMGSVPISEKMFEQQKKIKSIGLAVISLGAPIGVGQVMRAGAADAFNSTYADYQKSFKANMSSNKKFDNNTTENNETANLSFGEINTEVASNNKKSKTTKNTKKYLAGSGQDESSTKRTFYS